jgi:antitoxin YefM
MRAITYSEAQQNLAAELDRVVNHCDITIITREQAESGVLMSMHDYESLIETAYLLCNPKNAKRLLKAIEDIEAQKNLVQVANDLLKKDIAIMELGF